MSRIPPTPPPFDEEEWCAPVERQLSDAVLSRLVCSPQYVTVHLVPHSDPNKLRSLNFEVAMGRQWNKPGTICDWFKPGEDCYGMWEEVHRNGWVVRADVQTDFCLKFSAEHDVYGKVWADFGLAENQVHASSQAAYADFARVLPKWCVWKPRSVVQVLSSRRELAADKARQFSGKLREKTITELEYREVRPWLTLLVLEDSDCCFHPLAGVRAPSWGIYSLVPAARIADVALCRAGCRIQIRALRVPGLDEEEDEDACVPASPSS